MNDFYFTWVCFFFFQSLNINIKKTVTQTEAVSNQFNCGALGDTLWLWASTDWSARFREVTDGAAGPSVPVEPF